MPNFAVTLKEEIRRLARKEVRAQVTATKKAAAQHRRDIARLKREIKVQEKRVGMLASRLERQGAGAVVEAASELDGLRFSARSVRAQRNRLKLSAEDYGRLVGVSGQTIYHWEQGKSRPRKSQMAALVSVRGIGKRQALAQLSETTTNKRRAPGRPKGRRGRKPR